MTTPLKLLFLPARRYPSAGLCDAILVRVFATATYPSVSPSRAGIVSKQRKLALRHDFFTIW